MLSLPNWLPNLDGLPRRFIAGDAPPNLPREIHQALFPPISNIIPDLLIAV